MIDEVSPSHYAAAQPQLEFRIKGHNLDLIPLEAFGVIAYENGNPMQYENNSFFHATIVSRTDEEMIIRRDNADSFQECYLGGISDGVVRYWVNNSSPL